MQEGIHVLENPRLMKKGRRKRDEKKQKKEKTKDEANISVQNIHKKGSKYMQNGVTSKYILVFCIKG